MTTTRNETRQSAMTLQLETIARKVLGIETLATRNSDRLDFHDLAIWTIKAALQQAYEAGCAAAQ